MEEIFVTKEIALKVQELGFDKNKCIMGLSEQGCYRHKFATTNIGETIISWSRYDNDIPLPTWGQVIEWLIDKHKLSVEINLIDNAVEFYYEYSIVCFINRQHNGGEALDQAKILFNDLKFKSYQEAREAGVLKAIDVNTLNENPYKYHG